MTATELKPLKLTQKSKAKNQTNVHRLTKPGPKKQNGTGTHGRNKAKSTQNKAKHANQDKTK